MFPCKIYGLLRLSCGDVCIFQQSVLNVNFCCCHNLFFFVSEEVIFYSKFFLIVVSLPTFLTLYFLTSPIALRYHRCFRKVYFSSGKSTLKVRHRLISGAPNSSTISEQVYLTIKLFHMLHRAPVQSILAVGLMGDGYEI